MESIELLLDEGMGLTEVMTRTLGTEFEQDDLLRMDTATLVETIDKAVKAGVMKPDEGRKKLNYGPVPGGNAAYLQQQNFSLAALAKRDAKEDPFAKGPTAGGGFVQNLLPAPGFVQNLLPALAPPDDKSTAPSAVDIELGRHLIKTHIDQYVAAA